LDKPKDRLALRRPTRSLCRRQAQAPTTSHGQMGRKVAWRVGRRWKLGRKIPRVISYNDELYFAMVSGWTHTERWQPSAEDEAERLRKEGVVRQCKPKNGTRNGHIPRDGEGGRRVLGIKSRALSLVRPVSQKNDPQTLIDGSHERCIIAKEHFYLGREPSSRTGDKGPNGYFFNVKHLLDEGYPHLSACGFDCSSSQSRC